MATHQIIFASIATLLTLSLGGALLLLRVKRA